jgi:hypothetical protein
LTSGASPANEVLATLRDPHALCDIEMQSQANAHGNDGIGGGELNPPSPAYRRFARWSVIPLAALAIGIAWWSGPSHVLTLGVPAGIVAVVFFALGDRWWSLCLRQRALITGGMLALVTIPDIAAVNHLGWHDRLYMTEAIAWLGFFTIVHFGIKEVRRGQRGRVDVGTPHR